MAHLHAKNNKQSHCMGFQWWCHRETQHFMEHIGIYGIINKQYFLMLFMQQRSTTKTAFFGPAERTSQPAR